MKMFFRKFAQVKAKRKNKDPDLLHEADFELTQESFSRGWSEHIGHGSTVVADLIYIHASKRKEHIKFNFLQSIGLFKFLHDDNKTVKNKLIYKFLDLDKSKKLNVLTLLQISKKLPDRTLFKFEL